MYIDLIRDCGHLTHRIMDILGSKIIALQVAAITALTTTVGAAINDGALAVDPVPPALIIYAAIVSGITCTVVAVIQILKLISQRHERAGKKLDNLKKLQALSEELEQPVDRILEIIDEPDLLKHRNFFERLKFWDS